MEKTSFICPRCHNSDTRYIGYRLGIPYCRKCISYQGAKVLSSFECKKDIILTLDYPLSQKQQEVSDKVLQALKERKNVLIHAVTGAGKTELVYAAMESYLRAGKHVGFSTPRKDVVIELTPRIQQAFKNAQVISVYGEHNDILTGDIIVLTTHQLYRYERYFDLLILDEIDAFPYCGNDVLNSFFYQAVKGQYVLLSATPSKKDIERIKKDNGVVINLFQRYHQSPLPVPEFVKTNWLTGYVVCLKKLSFLLQQRKPVFVFVPTIDEGKRLFFFLSVFCAHGAAVSSKEEKREEIISAFKNHEYQYLVTTSILERGVTVKNLQVIVYHADHDLFTSAALVQIAGRVGRKMDAKEGKVYFLGNECNGNIKRAIAEIDGYNRKMFL